MEVQQSAASNAITHQQTSKGNDMKIIYQDSRATVFHLDNFGGFGGRRFALPKVHKGEVTVAAQKAVTKIGKAIEELDNGITAYKVDVAKGILGDDDVAAFKKDRKAKLAEAVDEAKALFAKERSKIEEARATILVPQKTTDPVTAAREIETRTAFDKLTPEQKKRFWEKPAPDVVEALARHPMGDLHPDAHAARGMYENVQAKKFASELATIDTAEVGAEWLDTCAWATAKAVLE